MLAAEERTRMISRMYNWIFDCKENELREEIIRLKCEGGKGFDNMTDEELQAEYDSYEFED